MAFGHREQGRDTRGNDGTLLAAIATIDAVEAELDQQSVMVLGSKKWVAIRVKMLKRAMRSLESLKVDRSSTLDASIELRRCGSLLSLLEARRYVVGLAVDYHLIR
jgi:hypothetical protein